MKLRIIAQLLIVISFMSLSCSEEGPAGPAGATGATGAAGPTGATGTANVIYVSWFTPSSYEATTIFGITHFTHSEAAPELTQEVLDNGVVLVYAKLLGYNILLWPADQVGQLPITLTYTTSSTEYDTWSAFASVGNLTIDFLNSINHYSSIITKHQFRYVVIPGGVAASDGGRVASYDLARLQAMPYEDAMAALGIPE